MGHIQRMDSDRLVKRIYEGRETGKRKRWNEEIRKAVEMKDMGWRDVSRGYQDRSQ